jgi:hypothetical protein
VTGARRSDRDIFVVKGAKSLEIGRKTAMKSVSPLCLASEHARLSPGLPGERAPAPASFRFGGRRRFAQVAVLSSTAILAMATVGAVAIVVLTLSSTSLRAGAEEPVSVLELFTSQGCAACPPADKLLGQFAQRKDIIALSLPVSYWDYLGWKDTLAQTAYSARQQVYSDGRGEQIYTPQLVVNGVVGVVGSDKKQIEQAISTSLRVIEGSRVSVDLIAADDAVTARVGAALTGAAYHSGSVWVAWLTRRAVVDVKSGENQGKRLRYYNVVRELKRTSAWNGEAGTFRLANESARKHGYDTCVVLVQAGDGGPILGAGMAPASADSAEND